MIRDMDSWIDAKRARKAFLLTDMLYKRGVVSSQNICEIRETLLTGIVDFATNPPFRKIFACPGNST